MKAEAQPMSSESRLQSASPQQQTAQALQAAMRGVASTVFLITTIDETRPHGMAASAVISVSMDPPAMLIAVNRNASINPILGRTGRFCVNVLADDHGHVVAPFANSARRHERFVGEEWLSSEEGLPFLQTAQAAIFCSVDAQLEYGSHTVLVGRVERVVHGRRRAPLVWLDGGPASVGPSPA